MKYCGTDIKSWGGVLSKEFMQMLDSMPDKKCNHCKLAGIYREDDIKLGRDWYCAMYGEHIWQRQCNETDVLKWLIESL